MNWSQNFSRVAQARAQYRIVSLLTRHDGNVKRILKIQDAIVDTLGDLLNRSIDSDCHTVSDDTWRHLISQSEFDDLRKRFHRA